MLDLIRDNWSFLPYLALLGFLAIMSLTEKRMKMDAEKITG